MMSILTVMKTFILLCIHDLLTTSSTKGLFFKIFPEFINPLETEDFNDKITFVHDPLTTRSKDATFIQYFLGILKHPLQNY